MSGKYEHPGTFKFSPADIAKIRQLHGEFGISCELIGRQFNCSKTNIQRIVKETENHRRTKRTTWA